MKGTWLVEVWAYDTHGNHVPAPRGSGVLKYSSNSNNQITVKKAADSEVINV